MAEGSWSSEAKSYSSPLAMSMSQLASQLEVPLSGSNGGVGVVSGPAHPIHWHFYAILH